MVRAKFFSEITLGHRVEVALSLLLVLLCKVILKDIRCRSVSLIATFSLFVVFWILPSRAAEVGQWDIFEASVRNPQRYNNPYKDVSLNVTYTKPDGSKVKFWGFYDGGNTWKIRFMPDLLGTWKYLAKFSDGQTGVSGSFQSVSSSIPGMVSADETNPRWFGYKGGKHELIRSFHSGSELFSYAWDDPSKKDDGNKRTVFLNWIQDRGYNMLSVGNFIIGKNGFNKLWPLNATEYRKTEAILNDLTKRKLLVYPFYGFFGNGTDYPQNPADRELYIKYVLARFGSYWNLFLNVAGPEPNLKNYLSLREVKQQGFAIAKADVFDHLLGIHNKDGDDPYRYARWASFTTLQGEYTDLVALNRYFLKNHTGNRPVYAQETLWPGNVLQPFANAPLSTVRKHVWVHMMSAVSLNYGDQDGRNSSGFSGSLDPKDAIQARHDVPKKVWDFMETVPFYRMKPCPEVVSSGVGFCLGEAGKHYLVYVPSRGSVSLRLPGKAQFRATWINGQNTRDRRSAGVGTDQQFSSPFDGDDWLLELKAEHSLR